MCDLLWSDPQDLPGRSPSKRGVGCQFGPDITEDFCKRNGLDYVIRWALQVSFSSLLNLMFLSSKAAVSYFNEWCVMHSSRSSCLGVECNAFSAVARKTDSKSMYICGYCADGKCFAYTGVVLFRLLAPALPRCWNWLFSIELCNNDPLKLGGRVKEAS